MTRQELREHYAGLAMQGILSNTEFKHTIDVMVQNSIDVADALIEAIACKHEQTQEIHGVTTCKHCHEQIKQT